MDLQLQHEYKELILISQNFLKEYFIKEIKNITFYINPITISKSGLAFEYVEKGKRKKNNDLVGDKIFCFYTELPPIKDTINPNRSRGGTSFEDWDQILEQYLIENEVLVFFDGRKNITEFENDNSKAFDELRANIKSEPFEFQKEITLPNEIEDTSKILEGSTIKKMVNYYERNAEARNKCIEHFGYTCQACELDMQNKYGEIGKEFIHVHHKIPLSEINEKYEVDPINDLIPLCPNCHAMAHRSNPPFTVAQLKDIIAQNSG